MFEQYMTRSKVSSVLDFWRNNRSTAVHRCPRATSMHKTRVRCGGGYQKREIEKANRAIKDKVAAVAAAVESGSEGNQAAMVVDDVENGRPSHSYTNLLS